MTGENADIYNGTDRQTGLHDSYIFSTELDHRKGELRHSGETNALVMVRLPEDAQPESIKEVAEQLSNAFIRLCRYEKMGNTFIGMYEETSDVDEFKQKLQTDLGPKHSGVRITSTVFGGNSPSLEVLAEQLARD